MRFSIAYYLLLLYITVICKPLIPIVSDVLSHTFAEAQHLATIHAKYGAHHLEKQLLAGEQDTNAKDHNTAKATDPVPAHFAEKIHDCCVDEIKTGKHYPVLTIRKLPVTAIPVTTPPPNVLL